MINTTKKTTTSGYIKSALLAVSLTTVSSMAHSFSGSANKFNQCYALLSGYLSKDLASVTIEDDMKGLFGESFDKIESNFNELETAKSDMAEIKTLDQCLSATKALYESTKKDEESQP